MKKICHISCCLSVYIYRRIFMSRKIIKGEISMQKIYTASNEIEAEDLACMLKEHGIVSYTKEEGSGDYLKIVWGISVYGTGIYVEEDDEREARKWIEKYCLRQAEPAQCQDEEKRSHRESSNIIRTPWYRNRAVTARIILGGAAAMVAVLIGVSLYFG